MADPIPDTAILLTRVEQVRALARLLLTDDAAAEDVAQDALVVALKRGDESAGPLPAWLRATVRSLASRVRRSRARRIRREHAAARSEVLPSTAQLCERASVQRTVVDAVIELEEPYRTAILLRYFEGLLPAEIAGHLRVPVATVKKRLSRGREQLRARLERRLGPEMWSTLVLPLALRHPSPAHVAQATGVLFVSSNLKLIVSSAIVLVLVALTVVLQPGAGPPAPEKQLPVEAAQLTDLESPSIDPTHIAPVVADGERVVAELSRTETEPAAAPVAEAIEGRVINGAGEPVPGVTVRLEQRANLAWKAVPNTPTAVTDALGIFRVPQAPGYGRVGVTSERYVTVIGPTWPQRGDPGEPTIVVGERSSYSGIVVDRDGNPLPGATVIFRVEFAVLRKLFQGEERPLEETWIAFTGAGGEFAMRDIGWLPGTMLSATLDPFERADVALDPGDFIDLQVVLQRPTGGQNSLHGRVVRADGGSVVGAQVAYAGGKSVAGAPDGTFVLDLGQDPTPGVLLAVLGGYLPARLEISDPLRASENSRAAPVVLQLEGYALSIAGNVVDAAGEPIAKAWVWTEDGAPFSRSRTVEDVAAIDTKYARRVSRRAEVDGEGKFEIKGLLDTQYDFYAVHPETFRVVQIPGVNAGSRDVRFVFDDESSGVRVAGRVLYRDGEPAPRVRLYPQLGPRSSSGLGRPPFLVHSGRSTDAEGRFEFPALYIEGMRLWVTGSEIGEPADDIKIELERYADVERIEIRVPRVVRFEVVLRGDPDQADRFGVADGDGRLLGLLYTLSSAGMTMMGGGATMKLSAGRSEVVSCSEDVRTVILYRGDEEIRRIPVRLKVGELTVLEF